MECLPEIALGVVIEALPVAIYTTDAEGRITLFNSAAVRLSGRVPELGSDRWCVTWKLYREDGSRLPLEECPMAVALKGGHVPREPRIIAERPDGSRAWITPYPTVLRDSRGTIVGGINLLLDVTERVMAEDLERKSNAAAIVAARTNEQLAAIVECSDDAIISKDLNGIISSWNAAATRLFGYTPDEAIGQPITILIPRDRADEELEILRRIRQGERVEHFETVRRRKDGTLLDISLTVSPLIDDRGTIVGASKIARDITGRKLAQRALVEADRRKNEFLATLAHELRNPLAPIRNSLNILRLTQSDAPAANPIIEMLERQVNHMVRLVDDLLEIARITTGKIELRREPVEIAAIIRSAVETSRPLIDAGRHQLATVVPPLPLTVDADPMRLSQVVANLLNNAAKYTEPGGQIWLTVSRDGGDVVVSVRDSGIGIAADVLPHVLEMFTQARGARMHCQDGLGIGLALVKRLVELHGGRVEAKSEGEGCGSEFIVRLPLSERQWPVSVDPPSADRCQEHGTRQRILVVDDNEDASSSLALLLQILGNDVETARDGLAALDAFERFRPSVVLLDLGMPDMNGFEVARRLRELAQQANVTLVALTGWGQEDDRRRTQEAGFDHHLVKPVNLDTLRVLLADAQGH